MKDNSISIGIYFKNELKEPLELITFFVELIKKHFNLTFDDISYSIINIRTERDKDLKFNNKNLEKYLKDIEISDDKGFQLSTYLDECDFKSRDMKFSVMYNYNVKNTNCSLNLVIHETLISENKIDEIKNIFIEITKFLCKKECVLNYGFIFSMENEKYPLLFSMGIGNPYLTKHEEEKLALWRKNRSYVNTLIWDIFWGNLFTLNQIKNDKSFESLIDSIGSENLIKIDKNSYFFWLNSDSLDFEKNDNLKQKFLPFFNF